ncbi:MAG: aldo/keto reductase [Geodermatophilaceae bacterium]|nr:aldo/keto reductase [Geodermatophilaceae bacterium]
MTLGPQHSSSPNPAVPVHASGTFTIAGTLPVHRLGFGAMRITGPGVWGEPGDVGQARGVLREAVRLGVDFIDTAQAYGPEVSERLIADALHPYPAGLVIATKGGVVRRDRDDLGRPDGRPQRLRADCEGSLTRLRLNTIDLWQLHRIDPNIALEDQIGTVRELQDEGKIRHFGLSQVNLEQLQQVRALIGVATVQNLFNYADRTSDDVLAVCQADGIGFIPWYPLATGELARPGSPLAHAAQRHGVTTPQIALAWLLHRSPAMIPIPGTSSIAHLRENANAALIQLSADELRALAPAAATGTLDDRRH